MNKTKITSIIFMLLIALVVTGCSGNLVGQSDSTRQHNSDEEVTQAAWYETESIDPDWPF